MNIYHFDNFLGKVGLSSMTRNFELGVLVLGLIIALSDILLNGITGSGQILSMLGFVAICLGGFAIQVKRNKRQKNLREGDNSRL